MNKEKRRVPKLRFPGFTEDWEQCKLESLGKIITGNTPSTLKKEYWSANSEGVVWITPTDINSVKTDCSERLLTEEGASQARIVPANSILVTCIASIGKNTINTVEAAFNQQINALVPHLSNSYFILTMLNNMESAFKRVAGTSATSIINKKEFGQLSALLPSVEEQNKIGEIFELIDKSITLHQRKLEHLNLKKKALLQKLFPKNGERYPELRFPGFTDAWEQCKADYIFESVTDKGYPELPVLSASQELGMVYRDQNGIDIQHDKKNEASYKRVLPGQFVIHLRSFQGGFAYSEIEGITSPAYTIMSFKNANEQYGLFWKHVFKSETFIKRLETITYGIRDGRSISFSDFKSLILRYPSFSEQKLIGDSLAVVEKGITLHQRKLEHLQLQKKALLQQLFI